MSINDYEAAAKSYYGPPPIKDPRYGAVVVFPKGLKKAEVVEILLAMNQCFGATHSGVNAFDEKYGGPVWYVP